MISEHQFATHYSSSWRTITPLADGYWTIENLMVDRVEQPLHPSAPKNMRAVVNETAFRSFCKLHGKPRKILGAEIFDAIREELPGAASYVGRFSQSPSFAMSSFDQACFEEAEQLVWRLLNYFPGKINTILRPKFSGCGLLSECEGDIIEGTCLYEIKAGDRNFRVVDLRQLLTYSALAYAQDKLSFSDIGIFNPRTGVAWRKSLEEVSYALSGLRLNDTLSSLMEQFSSVSASR